MAKEMIEVLRVVNDGGKVNMGARPECLDIDDIKSFREWHKGPNDKYIEGAMTIIVLEPKKQVEETVVRETEEERRNREKPKMRTWLIQEHYQDFKDRMGAKIPVKALAVS